MTKQRALLVFLLKLTIGIGLLAIFFFRLDPNQFFQAFSSARLSYVLIALFAYLLGKALTAVRWALLARPLGFFKPLGEFIAFYYIGMFFNLVGPSTLGGDAAKVFYLSREKSTGPESGRAETAAFAVVSILADRILGMAALVWIGAAALVVFPEYAALVPTVVRYATYALAAGSLAAWPSFIFWQRLLKKIEQPFVKKLYAVGGAYWNRPGVLARAFALSLIFHLIQIWVQILLGDALDFDLPAGYAFVFFPLVDIAAMLPVTVSGIGFREGVLMFFLKRLGVGPEKAVACGILWLAIVIASGLVGGLAFVARRRHPQLKN
jgi:uncharacterized membrane protein YbhN (UPF0104 family)